MAVSNNQLESEAFQELSHQATQLERGGNWNAAARLYAAAFQHCLAGRKLPDAFRVLLKQARVHWQQGAYEVAEELAELGWTIAERHGEPELAARSINIIAAAHYARQELSKAAALYQEAYTLAFNTGDDELVGFTTQNLGIIANILGNLDEARALYLESISSTARSGDRQTAMMAYNNLAMVCADRHDWMESEVYFDRGIEIAEQLGDVPMQAKLRANRAETLIHTNQLIEAQTTLYEAERLAIPIRELGTLADVARFRAMIAREQGNFSTAEQYIADSLRLAAEAGLELERAEALEELACLLSAEGQTDKAVATLSEAHERYEALGAKRDAARTREVLESWSVPMSTAASTLPEVVP
jgi:tetratricopeptide (TPR) repeat protein